MNRALVNKFMPRLEVYVRLHIRGVLSCLFSTDHEAFKINKITHLGNQVSLYKVRFPARALRMVFHRDVARDYCTVWNAFEGLRRTTSSNLSSLSTQTTHRPLQWKRQIQHKCEPLGGNFQTKKIIT